MGIWMMYMYDPLETQKHEAYMMHMAYEIKDCHINHTFDFL